MVEKLKRIINLVGNMGWRYTAFRIRHELLRRSGLLQKKFPAAPPFQKYVSLNEWRNSSARFFFETRESLSFPRNPQPELKKNFNEIVAGRILLFNSIPTDLGTDYDWVTNPDSGFKYDIRKHWTEIADYSKEAGDIKFVWEKSRFSYLYDIIRYDYHYNTDCAEFVFRDILSWIRSNPVNCGPNYRCSQEMSLRVMNWLFALHYYKNSPHLTEDVFAQMQYAIYWHMDHVYKNIDFSRIAVRNNHAITESLGLYLAGMFFPSMPAANTWKTKGKAWFEEEIAYQVYEDGTYLQFSMNYHRIVVQLLTWAIVLSEKNDEALSSTTHDRARKSLEFLSTCMTENGWLPNYGANDGALFFKLSSTHFRDYRPQLQALGMAVGKDPGFAGIAEDAAWYGITDNRAEKWQPRNGIHNFPVGGYYIIREPDTLTLIRCGSYKDRPSQADNMHLDIWYKGENILLDAGSYKYNTDEQTIRYFAGTQSHNTVMLGNHDQMLKGGRFIWYYWTKRIKAALSEKLGLYIFEGTISAFGHLGKNIVHTRAITKYPGQPLWSITDTITGKPATEQLIQLWHLPIAAPYPITIIAQDEAGTAIPIEKRDGQYSSLYGRRETSEELYFSAPNAIIKTEIRIVAQP